MRYLASLLMVFAVGCGDAEKSDSHDPERDAAAAGSHGHAPKMGGTLVDLDHLVQVEFVLDPEAGRLTAHIWNGHVESAVKIAQGTIDVTVRLDGGRLVTVSLEAQASELSGDTVGNSSRFSGVEGKLKGRERVEGMIEKLEARGQTWTKVEFRAGKDEK